MDFKTLKTYIFQRLSSLSSIHVYNGIAPSEANFPYICFNITSSFEIVRGRSDKILELDYWNDSMDDTILLEESEKIKKGFNYMWQSETEGFLASYLEFEAEIPSSEKGLSHINQRFILKVR